LLLGAGFWHAPQGRADAWAARRPFEVSPGRRRLSPRDRL